ncbi:MAG: peptide ABC transporter substrate-binding protein [Planctomycetota bacterium]|nr:MAG: peptide ABC transporter substrate-binding protein [Planctomycetota bacterium]
MAGFLVVGIALSLYAAREREAPADFRYVNTSGIHTLDPARMSWTQDFRVALNIWEGLTTWDPKTLQPLPAAADPPAVSADGRTYTFHLRPDGRWSNGDPVTAGDFIRGWRRAVEPGTAADYAFLLTDNIAGTAEYVRLRRRAVVALTVLSRLADGWAVRSEWLRPFTRHPVFETLRPKLARMGMQVPADSDDETGWERLGAALQRLDVDWSALHAEVAEAHRREFDRAFQEVGLEAPDDRTLIVRLRRPCPYFLDLLGLPVFLPVHTSIERLREHMPGMPFTREGLVLYDPQWTKPDYDRNGYPGLITNGPYRLAEWVFKRRLRLRVNPYHRRADGIGSRVVDMLVYEHPGAALLAYEAGRVDFIPGVNVPYAHQLVRLARNGRRPDFHITPVLASYFLNFNCSSETVDGVRNPFRDARVRKAFAAAVDKRVIVENVLARGDRVADSLVPPGVIPGYDPPAGLAYDPEAARRLLADAGYPDGRGFPRVVFLYTPGDERVVQALARMWEETLGVRVRPTGRESKTFAEDKAHRRFMIARGNWYADYNDPTTFLACFTSDSGNNDSGYRNPAFDDLLREADRQTDPILRMRMLREAEAMLVERDLPVLPILHYAELLAIRPEVRGLVPNARLWFPFSSVTVER